MDPSVSSSSFIVSSTSPNTLTGESKRSRSPESKIDKTTHTSTSLMTKLPESSLTSTRTFDDDNLSKNLPDKRLKLSSPTNPILETGNTIISSLHSFPKSNDNIPEQQIGTDEPMSMLATAINKHSTIHHHEYGDIIELKNAYWFGFESNKLFIRKFYNHIVENLMGNFNSSNKRRFIIIGSSGISKSGFGNYLLYKAITLKRTIIYANRKRNGVYYLFKYDAENDIYHVSTSTHYLTYNNYLHDQGTVFISDTMDSTPYYSAFSILITSPNIARWKKFSTDSAVPTSKLVFNPFTLQELLQLRSTCFPDISEEIVNKKFKRWGGNVRATFVVRESDDQSEFEQVIGAQTITIDILIGIRNLNLESAPTPIVHRLFHLSTMGFADKKFDETLFSSDEFYRFKEIRIASEEIAELFRKDCDQATLTAVSNLLRTTSPSILKMFTKGRGDLFELYAQIILKNGGNFDCFRLGIDSVDEKITIEQPPNSDDIPRVSNLDQLQSTYRPHLQNQMIFSIHNSNLLTINVLFGKYNLGNMTVDMEHTILLRDANKSDDKAGGLLQIVENLKIDFTTTKLPFYWIVPQDIYDEWYKKRKYLSSYAIYDSENKLHTISREKIINSASVNSEVYVTTNEKKSFSINHKYIDLVKNIDQYVMKINFPH